MKGSNGKSLSALYNKKCEWFYIYIYINQRSILSNNPDLAIAIAIVELGETSNLLSSCLKLHIS